MIAVSYKMFVVALAVNEAVRIYPAGSLTAPDFTAFVPSSSLGTVYIGGPDVDSDWPPLEAGTSTTFLASENAGISKGEFFDFQKLFAYSTVTGSILRIIYPVRA